MDLCLSVDIVTGYKNIRCLNNSQLKGCNLIIIDLKKVDYRSYAIVILRILSRYTEEICIYLYQFSIF